MLLGSAPCKDAPRGPGGQPGPQPYPGVPEQFTPWGQCQQCLCHQATAARREGMSPGISGIPSGHLQGVSALCWKGP